MGRVSPWGARSPRGVSPHAPGSRRHDWVRFGEWLTKMAAIGFVSGEGARAVGFVSGEVPGRIKPAIGFVSRGKERGHWLRFGSWGRGSWLRFGRSREGIGFVSEARREDRWL